MIVGRGGYCPCKHGLLSHNLTLGKALEKMKLGKMDLKKMPLGKMDLEDVIAVQARFTIS